jgi:hypothetical protein
MARRRNNSAGSALVGVAILIGGICLLVSKLYETVGIVIPLVVLGVLIFGTIWFKHSQRQKRIKYLLAKYGDQETVDRIMRRTIWQGETAQQVIDSLGDPLSVDMKVMATRKREIWKYHQTGRGRYALRVTLDNDVVTGIDHKTS